MLHEAIPQVPLPWPARPLTAEQRAAYTAELAAGQLDLATAVTLFNFIQQMPAAARRDALTQAVSDLVASKAPAGLLNRLRPGPGVSPDDDGTVWNPPPLAPGETIGALQRPPTPTRNRRSPGPSRPRVEAPATASGKQHHCRRHEYCAPHTSHVSSARP